jgi:F-type H+-transporting ATPase subunit a
MGLVYSLLPWYATIGFGAALSFYFDLFAGVIQALIFTMLSMTFVGNKLKA